MYTFEQFHKMNAYIEKISTAEFNVRFFSYNTLMLYINEKDNLMFARDYCGTTTQKQVTLFLREFYGEKWVKAYKTAIKFYRRFNAKKVLSLWFYIKCDKTGTFHFTFKNDICKECKIEFYQN